MSTLSDAEIVDIRRWIGYALASAAGVETVYTPGPPRIMFLDRLDALTVSEEEALRNRFLTPLASLEAAILTAADTMDTKQAGPWIANENEVSERVGLYNRWRRDMCDFLGFAPGPALGGAGGSGGGVFFVRA